MGDRDFQDRAATGLNAVSGVETAKRHLHFLFRIEEYQGLTAGIADPPGGVGGSDERRVRPDVAARARLARDRRCPAEPSDRQMGVGGAFEGPAAFQGLSDDPADAPLRQFLLPRDLVVAEAYAQSSRSSAASRLEFRVSADFCPPRAAQEWQDST